MSVKIAAVIPTRNRASYAIAAVRSLLDQDVPIDIYVCDNSTSPEALRAFCRDQPRVTYLRPERELAMGGNWDWAIRQALAQSDATHLTVHYDRRFSKPKLWGRLATAAARWPDDLISFPVDHVGHQPPPLRVWQTPWTGRYFAVRSMHIAGLISRGCVTPVAHALPVLSNCLVPRTVLGAVLDRFGDICNSTAPDGQFMMRFFSLRDRYIHSDCAQGILYGSRRSNGLGYMRNKGGDFGDFMRLSDDGAYLAHAPVPGVSLGSNMLFHEYELVRRATGDRFAPLDRAAALRELGSALCWIAGDRQRAALRRILEEQGWTGPEPMPFARRRWQDVKDVLVCRYHMKRHGLVPDTITGFAFRSDRRALAYALRYPRARQATHEHLDLLEPRQIDG